MVDSPGVQASLSLQVSAENSPLVSTPESHVSWLLKAPSHRGWTSCPFGNIHCHPLQEVQTGTCLEGVWDRASLGGPGGGWNHVTMWLKGSSITETQFKVLTDNANSHHTLHSTSKWDISNDPLGQVSFIYYLCILRLKILCSINKRETIFWKT